MRGYNEEATEQFGVNYLDVPRSKHGHGISVIQAWNNTKFL